MHSLTLSRTSSAASISSDDATRRTRKRFTSVQLMMLEQLFHQSSHPTREEREAVARAAGMEMKSVTIWFQNKRQTERKALHHATTQPTHAHAHRAAPLSSPSTLSSPYASTSTSTSGTGPTSHPIRMHTRTLSTTHVHTPHRKITPPRPRPSLDRIATRSESRLLPPRTPTRPHDPYASLWDNMPSSPLAPPASPPAHDLVEFWGGSRTLEWACAAARLAGKEGSQRPRARERELGHDRVQGPDGVGEREKEQDRSHDRDGELTEEDEVEAITPEGTLGASDAARWHGQGTHVRPRLAFTPAPDSAPAKCPSHVDKEVPQEEDIMRAALALCGLGRRSG
ncbi:homeobox-domain-containing protein [Boletus reticuloceps]|uniref:Homeobox-domain-containing protein n=1 Tax=Boletus reticuloceps TaxID=495285 RepID=A0A8I3A742_9AGAM|nr:homeobox-domain-containing protein [Boletus reticuloceps]